MLLSKEYTQKASLIVEDINAKLQELKDLSREYGGASFHFDLAVNDFGVVPPYGESKQEINSFSVGNETDWSTEDEEGNYKKEVVISQWFPSNMSC